MRLSLIVFIFIGLFYPSGTSTAHAANALPDTFKNFRLIHLGANDYHPDYGPVYIDPELKYEIVKDADAESGRSIRYNKNGLTVNIKYSNGPSEDPTFIINTYGKKPTKGSILGERLFITAVGDLYVDGKTDRYFDAKRKYTITPQGLTEVKQPFYLVDLSCVTNNTTTLTSERCGNGDKVATLPEGTKVRVLIGEAPDSSRSERMCPSNDSHQTSFLVATPFGLIGWVQTRIGSMYTPGNPLECIRYWGD